MTGYDGEAGSKTAVRGEALSARSYWIGFGLGVGLTVAALIAILWRGLGD